MSPEIPQLETTEEVMFFDTDAGGVVHNIAYLRFIETCRTRLAAVIGLNLTAMMAERQFPVVVRTEIEYRSPAKFGDILTIRGRLAEVGRARFTCRFDIHRRGDSSLLVACRQELALVDVASGRPLRLPADWRRHWPQLAQSGD
jgi:YbgC/YbaW family acyl-CoA thioester hydrolase